MSKFEHVALQPSRSVETLHAPIQRSTITTSPCFRMQLIQEIAIMLRILSIRRPLSRILSYSDGAPAGIPPLLSSSWHHHSH